MAEYLNTLSGDKIPALGLGTWKLEAGDATAAVRTAIEMGYRHIDCAWIYSNESFIGPALAQSMQDGIVERNDLWVTSKLWNDCHQREHVRPALEKTLADLALDYLDLYLIHWPVAHRHGVTRPESASDWLSLEDAPLTETWLAMDECRQAGLCRNIGVSNFSSKKIRNLIDSTSLIPAVNQVELHPYLQQGDLLDYCNQTGIVLTAYSPLGSGDRPDDMRQANEPNLFSDSKLIRIASNLGISVAQLMLAWAVNRKTCAIPKSSNPQRMKQNLEAAAIELDEATMNSIAELDRQYRFVDGTFWEQPGSPYTVASVWDE